MAKLNNQELASGITANLAQSFGPFLAVGDDRYVFDARVREFPLWLGYNASALFGMTQFRETWTGKSTSSFKPIETAYQRLIDRVQRSPCGRLRLKPRGQLKPAGILYHYISLAVLDQFSNEHAAVAREIEISFARLLEKHGDLFNNAHVDAQNFEFGIEFRDSEHLSLFVRGTSKAGILIDPWPRGSNQVKFVLNLSYRKTERILFWKRLDLLFRSLRGEPPAFDEIEIHERKPHIPFLEFHKTVIDAKATGKLAADSRSAAFLRGRLAVECNEDLDIVVLDRGSYRLHREKILAMQRATYEPARQTPLEEFELLFASKNPLGLLVLKEQQIVAMSFAGRLKLFADERGVLNDPFFGDPNVYYSMDLTVAPEFRGGLGKTMKQAIILQAIENGITAIHGRNRDRLARSMWAINLSLGSFELQHLNDDYPDDRPYRDCIYYRCPLEWENAHPGDADAITDGNMLARANAIGLNDVIIHE